MLINRMVKQILYTFYIFLFAGIAAAYAQPANDDCSTAQNLGSLPNPAACPSGAASSITITGTNVGATSPNPYPNMLGCQPAGNMAAPALDVWYSFTATGNLLNITMSGSLASPNVALWRGTCGNLVGLDCAIGNAAGNLTVTFQPVTPGTTYYLQVSGNSAASTGNFTMVIKNTNDCNNCLQATNITMTPSPVNGTYAPGQTVNFCFTISGYTQISSNWLHGVVPTFGCGWNTATLTTTPATQCPYNPTPGLGNPGQGIWRWYNSVTSSATGQTYGPGFFFDNANVAGTNAGQNYGDPTGGSCTWTFCWTITTKTSCSAVCNDLGITINTLADGESGSWTSLACTGDPSPAVNLMMSCCYPPTITQTNPVCNSVCNGTATATAVGVDSPWDFVWKDATGATILTQNNIITPSTATGLCAGTYTVAVTDNNNCTSTATVTITEPPVLTATQSQSNILCAGGSTTASVIASGGTAGYTYAWSPSGGSAPISTALTAGSYSCLVTDANGCTLTKNFTINEPSPLSLTTSVVQSTCSAANGQATVTVTGGTSGYTYSWSPSGGTGATISGLLAGSYTVTVTDVNGCVATANAIVADAPAPTSTISASTNVSCFNGTNGSATISVTGGTPGYTYAWLPSGGTNATASNLVAGSYSCTVTDVNGCTTTSLITITEPTALSATATATPALCNGGTTGLASVTATGGTTGYSYSWLPSGGTSATASNLTAGAYTVTITDANGCTTTAVATVTEPTPLTATQAQGTIGCNGGTTTATVVVSGGSGTYTYAWSPAGGTGPTSTTIPAGTYTCLVTDGNGCAITLNFNITEPAGFAITQTQGTILCNGGTTTASITALGGIGPYTYAWSPSGGSAATSIALYAGSYSCVATDANGCLSTANFVIGEPALLTATANSTPVACGTGTLGTADVVATGGVSPYAYVWSPSGGTGTTATGLAAGTYTVDVTDANGCTANATVNVIVNLAPTALFTATPLSGCEPLCVEFTDNSTISASGTIASWNWDFGDGTTDTDINPTHCFDAGSYDITLSVKSTDGCISTITLPNHITVYPNPVAQFSASPQPTTLLDSEIFFTNTSTGAAAWLWNFGDASSTTSQQQNPSFTYVDANCYDVSLTAISADGCDNTVVSEVCIEPGLALYVPNAFTPDGDFRNDTFMPSCMGIDPKSYEFSVFNRWGNNVFFTQNLNASWDGSYKGERCQIDTYIWKLKVVSTTGKQYDLMGKVTLIN